MKPGVFRHANRKQHHGAGNIAGLIFELVADRSLPVIEASLRESGTSDAGYRPQLAASGLSFEITMLPFSSLAGSS